VDPQFIASLLVSSFALLVSGGSLAWNIYRELGLRARLKVRFRLMGVVRATDATSPHVLCLSIVNRGPGRAALHMLHLKNAPIWRRIFRRIEYAALVHDPRQPLSGSLPCNLECSDSVIFTFSPSSAFMSQPFTHIGVSDKFDRLHWCSPKDFEAAKADLRKFKAGRKLSSAVGGGGDWTAGF
jgi:hypothetical protein